ncbi:MAG: peptidoglycan-binding domain-containing protein [Dokdonia sp.]|jgi:peptidoglycan hydrolase-like protein with peptidoglycan-binding domain
MKQTNLKTKPSFMTKNKDLLVVGGVIVVLSGAALTYYLMTKKKEKKKLAQASATTTATAPIPRTTTTFTTPPFIPVSSGSSSSSTRPVSTTSSIIKKGSRGTDVKILQRYLKIYKEDLGRSGPKRDGVDGIFGPKTARAAQKRLKKSAFTKADIAGMLKALKSLGK